MSNLHDIEDQQLMHLFLEENEDAYIEIYRRNWKSLFVNAYRRLKDVKQCEDIVQNVFLDLWERRHKVHIENISAYLHTAIKFQIIKYSSRLRHNIPLIDQFENACDSSLATENIVLESELMECILLLIDALPEKRREVFVRYYFKGHTTTEIAQALGITQKR